MTAEQERTWGMLAYVLPLGVNVLSGLGCLAALAVCLIHKDKSRFVAHHSFQALLFQFVVFLAVVAGAAAFATIIGILVAILLWVAAFVGGIVLPIRAGLDANKGGLYALPFVAEVSRKTAGY